MARIEMYEISVREHFDAAHALKGYRGKCERLHGHRYEVVVTLRADKLDDIGLAYDFSIIKKHLREVLSRFDHNTLNEVEPFDKINPSAENIAVKIYEELHRMELPIVTVQVYESPDTWVTYRPGDRG
jgi:6-pyruvoyltetrahydropterin/6-carboxytetrahydropterin synthase